MKGGFCRLKWQSKSDQLRMRESNVGPVIGTIQYQVLVIETAQKVTSTTLEPRLMPHRQSQLVPVAFGSSATRETKAHQAPQGA